MKLISTNQLGQEDNTSMVVYGPSGSGKTYAISTIKEPCLILSAEAGLRSLADFDYPAVEIEHPGQLMDILNWLASSKEAEEYTWVCLDSISEIAEQILNVELKANKDGRKAYGEMNVKTTAIVRAFRDLKKCVYMTAKQERVKDEFTGGLVCAPDMPGQRMRQQLPYLVDHVFALQAHKDAEGRIRRHFQTQGDEKFVAKTRGGRLKQFVPPDLTRINNLLKGVE
tara:strand:- start:840 stop:1517 length:678 start_codon:yes stop_codon:yes gene_type:complete